MVVLDYRGQVKWVYTGGNKQQSGSDKFYPSDITVTTSCLILVIGKNNHCVHVLNQTGDLIYCHHISDLGIELPCSLATDINGFLWVGCNTWTKEKSQRAKLHKLKFG